MIEKKNHLSIEFQCHSNSNLIISFQKILLYVCFYMALSNTWISRNLRLEAHERKNVSYNLYILLHLFQLVFNFL